MMAAAANLIDAINIAPQSPLDQAMTTRANVLAMTQAAEEAVLRPKDGGRWPNDMRAALAARIAALNAQPDIAAHYAADAGDFITLADPQAGAEDAVLDVVLAFMDKVAAHTSTVKAQDITALQAAGITDADIVRLAELNAFMSYYIRVITGLRAMGDMA